MSQRLRIGVFAGGPSNEREVSFKSAAHVMQKIDTDTYDVQLIEVTPEGAWEQTPLDVAFIAMHGTFAEDGTLQQLLDAEHIPFTGSGAAASALGFDKARTRGLVAQHGLTNPRFFELTTMPEHESDCIDRARTEVGFPCMVKPTTSGSSIGMSLVTTAKEYMPAVRAAFAESKAVLVESFVAGREFSCGVLGNTDHTELRTLPVVEIITTAQFFDYDAKYDAAQTREVCPADITPETTARIQEAAVIAHRAVGCDGLTRSDFILGEDGVLYFLEINTIPGMTEESICPKEAAAIGWTFTELIDKQIQLALMRENISK